MLIRYVAHTRTHTESYLDDVFRKNVKSILLTLVESQGLLSGKDRKELSKYLDTRLTESSPADMLSEISWAWQTESHEKAGGASGSCTIYIHGKIDKALTTSSCEIESDGLHLSVIAEIS